MAARSGQRAIAPGLCPSLCRSRLKSSFPVAGRPAMPRVGQSPRESATDGIKAAGGCGGERAAACSAPGFRLDRAGEKILQRRKSLAWLFHPSCGTQLTEGEVGVAVACVPAASGIISSGAEGCKGEKNPPGTKATAGRGRKGLREEALEQSSWWDGRCAGPGAQRTSPDGLGEGGWRWLCYRHVLDGEEQPKTM